MKRIKFSSPALYVQIVSSLRISVVLGLNETFNIHSLWFIVDLPLCLASLSRSIHLRFDALKRITSQALNGEVV